MTAPQSISEIASAPDAEWYPLSSAQLTMWLAVQSGDAHAAYTVPAVYRLDGELDVKALKEAFTELLRRHEALRTVFGSVDGVPRQRSAADAELDWTYRVAAQGTDRLIEHFVSRPFDLAAGRLLHVMLVQEAADHHVLVLAAHHIAVDGWSLTVLLDQALDAYRRGVQGASQEAEDGARLQYRDYAVWQQTVLDSGALDASREYWRQRFQEPVERVDLPADRPRPTVRSHLGANATRVLRQETVAALKDLCRLERTTAFAALSAALRVLVYRYSGQRDIALGTSAVNRPLPELFDQVGCYVNSVALRDPVAPGASFRELLLSSHRTVRGALGHAEYPFDRVVRDAGADTEAGRNALFDIMIMSDEGFGEPGKQVPGLGVQAVRVGNGHSKMDLTLFFAETPEGLLATVEYAVELFDANRIERLLRHFEVLLADAVARPDEPVEALELLDAAERELVMHGFNRTDAPYDLDTTVVRLFEEQVRRTPDAVAVVDEQRSWTFAELNAQANRLAWTLRDKYGVATGSLVALRLARSADLTAAVLGVLKAGGAYLPLSTTDPDDRVRHVLDDSGCAVVLRVGDAVDPADAADPPHRPDAAGPGRAAVGAHRRPAARRGAGRPRLLHLYLRVHRAPQGRPGRAPLPGQPAALDGRGPGPRRGRRHPAEDAVHLRCLRLGTAAARDDRRPAGHAPARGRVRPRADPVDHPPPRGDRGALRPVHAQPVPELLSGRLPGSAVLRLQRRGARQQPRAELLRRRRGRRCATDQLLRPDRGGRGRHHAARGTRPAGHPRPSGAQQPPLRPRRQRPAVPDRRHR